MKKKFVWTFIFFNLFLFAIWFFLFTRDVNGIQNKLFFIDHNDWFMDFYNVVFWSVDLHPYDWGWLAARNYLPVAYLLYYPFTKLFPYSVENGDLAYEARYSQYTAIAACMVITISFMILFYCLYKAGKMDERVKIGLIAVLLLSAPTIFSFDRANMIILVAGLLFGFFLTYDSEDKNLKALSIVLIVFASALKIYPAVFGVLYIYKKDFKSLVKCIILGVLVAFLPFFLLKGGFVKNITLFWECLKEFRIAKSIGVFGLASPTVINGTGRILVYLRYVMAAVSIFVAGRINKKWKQIMLLTMVVLLTSGYQSRYCILYLYYPIVLFFGENSIGKKEYVFPFLFTLIINPIQYDIGFSVFAINNITVANTVCIVMYFYLLIEGICLCKREKTTFKS